MTETGPPVPFPSEHIRKSVPFLFGMTSLFADMTYELAHVLLPVMMIHLGGSAAMTALMESSAEGTKLAGFLAAGEWERPGKESRFWFGGDTESPS